MFIAVMALSEAVALKVFAAFWEMIRIDKVTEFSISVPRAREEHHMF